MSKIAPYGTWTSPLTADAIIQNSASVNDVIVDPVTSKIYHVENRPSEGGRMVVVKTEEGIDVVGKDWNCRTGVHEYGGASATAYGGNIYFSNFADGRVYIVKDGKEPKAITPESKVHRYANFAVHPLHRHLLVVVQEDHTHPAPADVVNTLCTVDSSTQTVSSLLAGMDFYAAPSFSPDGSHLIWVQWSHPDMPWDGSEIYIASVQTEDHKLKLENIRHVAGQKDKISAGYPTWASNDVVLFTSDESGYQNPWKYTLSTGTATAVLQTPVKEDFSLPAWFLGGSYGAPIDKEGKMAVCTAFRNGRSVLYVVSLLSGTLEEIDCPYVSIEHVRHVVDDAVVFVGAKDDAPPQIVLCAIKDYSKPKFSVLQKETAEVKPPIPSSYISRPVPLTLEVPPNGEPLYVVFYPPTNPEYAVPGGEKPPCIVNVHGGPTGVATQELSLTTQFFTSRGWAWVDVNYGGSCGFGRQYINRLQGQWGVVEVRDCALSASVLAQTHSLIDPARTAIRGRSSGGFTVLATFKLDEFTHKFESRYCEKLIGGTFSDVPNVYKERSPINNAGEIKSPLLGSIDAVVPPQQAEDIVKTIKENGGQVEYVLFEGEGHGWRKAENIKAALEKELAFYEKTFGLKNTQ
ncbi:hypothetical protein EW026_g4586 [Hermanssonia centrifuga]|uniref:Peptidase S9 prolyl oligopeptidase catalytic domain-containing protein n=1 Tax=Hermanssonia centrifuga TaxID=98765 RepID=A0A4S4KHR3_9APHY|nr:hypothetical protein EW026_g4586 [Hermanssonia centrifuga]